MPSKNIDETRVELISHIRIRDPDTDEIILRQRDVQPKAEPRE
jgi:hypothetical protein